MPLDASGQSEYDMQCYIFCRTVLHLDSRGLRIYVFGRELFAFRFVRMVVWEAVCSVAL